MRAPLTKSQSTINPPRKGRAKIEAATVVPGGEKTGHSIAEKSYEFTADTSQPAILEVEGLNIRHALQDINLEELRPGRTGNEVLAGTRARMKERGIDGTVYSHPIGLHGHGAGPLIGLWDYQDGVPGRGDARVIPSTWFSIELQATTPVPEWGAQPVRMAQEEDAVVGADATGADAMQAARLRRQTRCHISLQPRF